MTAAGPAGPPRLFVYGTLAPGRPNAHQLADVIGTWEPATVLGWLVRDGWGAALGYPALVLDRGPGEPVVVAGTVLTSGALAEHWARLDEFEGDGYERVVVEVTLQDGSSLSAQTYVLRPVTS